MNIVDSSGWLEYFADTKNAKNFAATIENIKELLVPVITIYEVFKKVLQNKGEEFALQIIAHMKQGKVIDMNLELAIYAAKLSAELHLPMADSIILATAKKYNAKIWTQDKDFENQEGVIFFQKL